MVSVPNRCIEFCKKKKHLFILKGPLGALVHFLGTLLQTLGEPPPLAKTENIQN